MTEFLTYKNLLDLKDEHIAVFTYAGVDIIHQDDFETYDENSQVDAGEQGKTFHIFLVIDSYGQKFDWQTAQQYFKKE